LPVKNVLGRINAIDNRIYDYQDSQYVNITYQPMQCKTAPWDGWLESSGIKPLKAPTISEIITMYYGQGEYTVEMRNIVQINSTGAVCEACNVCPKEYLIHAEVPYKDISSVMADGWTKD